jgi:biopolymer transport protein ExbD
VKITSRDRILIAQRDVDWRSVRANIERLHAENPEAPVIVQPHPESSTEALVHVMDSARQAGVEGISLASNAPE